jgi:hypothetical protein
MLINQRTSDSLDILYGEFFNINSLFDNAVSFMLNEWAMVQANDIIHHRLAHLFPLLADKISEIKDDYDVRSIRPEVPQHNETYSNLREMFDALYNECEAAYEMIIMTNKIAMEEGDINVHAGLMEFMRMYSKTIGQVITLKNKAEQMPNDFDTFDFRIKDWGIVGIPELLDPEED